MTVHEQKNSSALLIKIGVGLLLAGAIAGVYFSPLRGYLTDTAKLREALGRIEKLWYAPLLFMAIYAAGCIVIVPATVFILTAGLIWGWKLGGTFALIGGVIGALGCYYIGGFMGGDALRRFGPKGQKVSDILRNASFRSLLVMRFIPIFPFAFINYGAGVAKVKARYFLISTAIGLAPSTFIVAYSADALFKGTLTKQEAIKRVAIVMLLIAAMIGIPMLFKRKAEQEMPEIAELEAIVEGSEIGELEK